MKILMISCYSQVELIDSQGNAVMKSLPTPVLFKTTPSTTTTTSRSPPTSTTKLPMPVTVERTSPTIPTLAPVRVSDERLLRIDNVAKDDLHGFVQDQADVASVSPRELLIPENTGEKDHVHSRGEFARNATERNKVLLAEVSATEIVRAGASEDASKVIIWCVGVSIGALLLLTLCSLVIWLLNRCRKSTRNEEEDTEEGLDDLQSSFRAEVTQQNVRNQTTSWTFENFCSVGRKSKIVTPQQRKDTVPAGIDNASLMENYVFMLESPPSGSRAKH